jgi:glycosyltransferase involved in cell wall biosynthesis
LKILYADTALRTLEGHHASSGAALVKAFRGLGHEVTVVGHCEVLPELQRDLSVKPLFRYFTYGGPSGDPIAGWLTNFAIMAEATTADFHRAWAEHGPFDFVFFNSVRPAQLAALALWMRAEFVNGASAPAVAVELGTEAGLTRSGSGDQATYSVREPTAILYRHVVNWIGKEQVGKIAFVTVNPTAAAEYRFILDLPVGLAPLPQPLPELRRRKKKDTITVGLLGHQRVEKGYQLFPDLVPLVLQQHANARFIVHQSDVDSTYQGDPQSIAQVTVKLRDLAGHDPRVELLLEPAVGDAWFALIDRCDIVALPYDPSRYQGAYSAILGEALASGAPVVVPADTTMAELLETEGRPGTTFKGWDAPSIAAAIGAAIDGFPNLVGPAYRAGKAWTERHGPARFAAAVIHAGKHGVVPETPARTRWSLGRLFGFSYPR